MQKHIVSKWNGLLGNILHTRLEINRNMNIHPNGYTLFKKVKNVSKLYKSLDAITLIRICASSELLIYYGAQRTSVILFYASSMNGGPSL